jgi:RNA-directed DNA polymerase
MNAVLSKLSERSGLPVHLLFKIVKTAPDRYKTFEIPKRTGGVRLISQPAREVKRLQRIAAELFLSGLPIHHAATAYRTGKSIRDNALPHALNGPILKMDFQDFFPSIKLRDWLRYCNDTNAFQQEEAEILGRLFFRRVPGERLHQLAIGAPSSPLLSNILLYNFDSTIDSLIEADSVSYTRYADDLTFSAERTGYLTGVRKYVKIALNEIQYPRLSINQEKTVYATRRFRRSITGLVLSNEGKVTIGRDRKRVLRAAVHRASLGQLNEVQCMQLCGMLAYVNAVEPTFLNTLIRVYGVALIRRIQATVHTGARVGRSTDFDWSSLSSGEGDSNGL